jgi:hypothetical protein
MLLRALVDTTIKKNTSQASGLLANEKFDLSEGESLEIKSLTNAASGHIGIILNKAVKGEIQWFAFRRHVKIEDGLNVGIQGADTLGRVTSDLLVGGATRLLGGIKPAYWGRYFSGTDFKGAGEYFKSVENNTLNKNNIRVLPIGRFTTQVGKGKTEGQRDGFDQANDFLVTFGEDYLESQGGEFYLFLDVEPDTPLSEAYYIGWADAVSSISRKVKMLPCIYLNAGDSKTSTELKSAMSKGADCFGLWIALYVASKENDIPLPPQEFESSKAKPKTAVDAPVLFWQYAGDIGRARDFDFNVSNPEISSSEILSHLVLPPAI